MNLMNSHPLKATLGVAAMALVSTAAAQQQYPPEQYPRQPYPQQQQVPSQPYYSGNAPRYNPEQLEQLVERIALYPDPLLAQVLTAATYPDQIPAAANWSVGHQYVTGNRLAHAMNEDRLPWNPSVVALLPFPFVLDMMARDGRWTQELGGAVLADRADVMDAILHLRQRAYDYGYLQNSQQLRVLTPAPGRIQIMPYDSNYYYVPAYDPRVVFAGPRRGTAIGLNFGSRISIGASFAPWGWRNPGFDWDRHNVRVDNHDWDRNWENRDGYAHPYVAPLRRDQVQGPPIERHERDVQRHWGEGDHHQAGDHGHDRR